MEQGNNILSNKIRRINIPLVRGTDTDPVTGRYFLPEDPELEKHTIIGIQAHSASDDISNFDFSQSYIGRPFVNLGTVQPVFQNAYLTAYNKKGEEQLFNFPVNCLYNGISRGKTKIFPFEFKINTRKSFIYIPALSNIGAPFIANITLTFFLK
jgi:hypothetical protein